MLRRVLMSVCVLTVATVTLVMGGTAHAQNNQNQTTTGNGLRISPVRNDLTIKPGSSQTVDVYLQNITDTPAKLKGVINDFVAAGDESGQPRPLLDGGSAPSHGLKNYIDKIGEFTLKPQERKIIKVRVAIPADAAGGGYFGLVRFVPTDVDESKNVSLSASVGSLFLVTVPGDIKEEASVASFNVARFDDEGKLGRASTFLMNGGKDDNGKGIQAVLRVKNSGNVQIAPFGKVALKKGGKTLATYEVNNTDPRGNVLPDSIRKFTVDLGDKTKSFGKYTLEGNFGYGSNGQLITASTSFYVIPLAYMLIAVGLVLILIAAILIIPRWLKAHDRKLIRKIRRNK